MRLRSFVAVSLGLGALVACGRFGIIEDEFGGGPPGSTNDSGTSGGPAGDAGPTKPPQPEEPPPPVGCEPGQTPHVNPACIAEAAGLFVDAAAAPDGDGTLALPLQRIQDAITKLDELNDGRRAVFVAAGAYPENVSFRERAFKLYGGLVPGAAWKTGDAPSVVAPPTGMALEVRASAQESRFEDFRFEASTPREQSLTTVAVLVADCGAAEKLVFERVTIAAGEGLPASPAGQLPADQCGGGGGEANGGYGGGGGGRGCSCAGTVVEGGVGAGLYSVVLTRDGAGGANNAAGSGGAGANVCGQDRDGRAGTDRSTIAPPAAGAAAPSEGLVQGDTWLERPGDPGRGGLAGGGGGGGGRDSGNSNYGGGGGGAGGCGGAAGAGGGGGGSSIGILAIRSQLRVLGAKVTTGSGGDGAAGGPGGAGQTGGDGGDLKLQGNACSGGRGGKGGQGSPGSGGGGGAGGASAAVVSGAPVEGAETLEHTINGTGGAWGGEPSRRGRPTKILALDPAGVVLPP